MGASNLLDRTRQQTSRVDKNGDQFLSASVRVIGTVIVTRDEFLKSALHLECGTLWSIFSAGI